MEEKQKIINFEAIFEQILIAAITTPLFILILKLFSDTVFKNNVERIFVDWFTYVLFIFSGLFYSFILYIFVKEKTKGGFYICFIFFYVIFEAFICFLMNRLDMPYVVIPFSIIHFFLEVVLNDVFVMHDAFLNHWEGKTGKDLETYLYHNNVEAGELGHSIKSFKNILIGIAAAFFIFSFFYKLSRHNYNFFMIINTLIFVISVFFGFFRVTYFNRESYYANMGFAEIIKNMRKYYKYVGLIFIFSALCAITFSRNEPVIKIHFKEAAPVNKQYEVKTELPQKEYEFTGDVDIPDLDDTLGNYKDYLFLQIIFQIVKIGAIAVLLFYVIYFLIRPFFTSGWKDFWKDRKLYIYFRKLLQDIKDFFAVLFGKDVEKFATVEANSFKASINNLLKRSKKSKEKKAELDRLTKQFINLIDWGNKRDIKYKVNLAPAEYTNLISEYFNKNSNALCGDFALKVGLLFEKALYDKELLTSDEETEYYQAIKSIISNGDK